MAGVIQSIIWVEKKMQKDSYIKKSLKISSCILDALLPLKLWCLLHNYVNSPYDEKNLS